MDDTRVFMGSMPILPSQGRNANLSTTRDKQVLGQISFQTCLESAREKQPHPVAFSSHAQSRLQERNIKLTSEDLSRLNSTVDKLARKGAKESLIYLQDVALQTGNAGKK